MVIPGPGIENMSKQGQLLQDMLSKVGITAKIKPVQGNDIATNYYINGGGDAFAAARLASSFYPGAYYDQFGKFQFVAIWNKARTPGHRRPHPALPRAPRTPRRRPGSPRRPRRSSSDEALEAPIAFMPQFLAHGEGPSRGCGRRSAQHLRPARSVRPEDEDRPGIAEPEDGTEPVGAYIARRLAALIPLLIIISFIVFSLSQLLPGDPAIVLAGGQKATPAGIAAAREKLHLDESFVEQYVIWLGDTAQRRSRRVVLRPPDRGGIDLESVSRHALARVRCVGPDGRCIGVPLGILAAVRQGGIADRLITTGSSVALAMPDFWLGMILLSIFAVSLKVLPSGGYVRTLGVAGGLGDAPLPALDRDGRPRRRGTRPPGARRHDRRAGTGLRPHRRVQGTAAAGGGVQARAEERVARTGDGAGYRLRLHARRLGDHRADLHAARAWGSTSTSRCSTRTCR